MARQRVKEGKKCRKYGRNEKSCTKYRATGRLEKNKARRMKRHFVRCKSRDAACAARYRSLTGVDLVLNPTE